MELVSLVPLHVGYWPTGSVVILVATDVPALQCVRADIADLKEADADQLVEVLVATALRPGSASVVLVVTFDAADDVTAARVRERVADRIGAVTGTPPLRWHVRSDVAHCDDPRPVGPCQFPTSQLRYTAAAARAALDGLVVADDRSQLRVTRVSDDLLQRTSATLTERRTRWSTQPDVVDTDTLAALDRLLTSCAQPEDTATLVEALQRVALRDEVLAHVIVHVADGPPLPATNIPGAVSAVLDDDPRACRPPNTQRAHQAIAVLCDVAAHTAGPRPAALTLAALLSWWVGRGAAAAELTAQALEETPGYTLATIVQGILRRGAVPGWCRMP